MTAESTAVADPFGVSVGERIWRRLAGAAVGVLPATGFGLWAFELLPWVVLGALAVYVLGVPASWLLGRRGGPPVLAHMRAAALIAVPAAALLAVPSFDFLLFWAVFTVIAVVVGTTIAGVAAWAGTRLPARWVRPVALTGLVVAFVAVPLRIWQVSPWVFGG